jgi:uncharacterized protein DUF6636
MISARSISTAAALLAAMALTVTGSLPAEAKTSLFRTPSKNVYCLYSSKGGPGPYIRCDVLSLNDAGFVLDRRHKAKRVKVTDTVADPNRASELGYGKSRRFGPFRCSSSPTGLTCKNRKRTHGFKLSRQKQILF